MVFSLLSTRAWLDVARGVAAPKDQCNRFDRRDQEKPDKNDHFVDNATPQEQRAW